LNQFVTVGKLHYPNYQMPLWVEVHENFTEKINERFRLVLLREGAGFIDFGGKNTMIIAPALICLNEMDEAFLKMSTSMEAMAIYFHPEIINSLFDFEFIRKPPRDIATSTLQDLTSLEPFLKQDEHYNRILPMGPITFSRIFQLLSQVQKQLYEQPDEYWPCRSRSIFFELLFLVHLIFENRNLDGNIPVPESVCKDYNKIDPIILYLHNYYYRKITIAELTKMFHINRTTLTQKFTESTGVSVIPYLLKIRVRVASLMLRDTTLPVGEVMERVGFNDITHFERVFRKHTGVSPSEYRQQYCWMLQKL
jgi:AraC-like DNA-binding protein